MGSWLWDPPGYQSPQVLEYMWIFDCAGVCVPNPPALLPLSSRVICICMKPPHILLCTMNYLYVTYDT